MYYYSFFFQKIVKLTIIVTQILESYTYFIIEFQNRSTEDIESL